MPRRGGFDRSSDDDSTPVANDSESNSGPTPWGIGILFWLARRQSGPLRKNPPRRWAWLTLALVWAVGTLLWTALMFATGGVQLGKSSDAEYFSWEPSRSGAIQASIAGAVILAAATGFLAWKWPPDEPLG